MKNRRVLQSKNYLRMPWKNGQGYTEQIAFYPEESDFSEGDFLWRLSTAAVTLPGSFSLFPQHQRFLVIIEGQGIELFQGQQKIGLSTFMPYRFSGAQTTLCQLPYGPVRDFNFFWKDGQFSPRFEILSLRFGEDFLCQGQGENNFLFVADGQLEMGESLINRFDTLCGSATTSFRLKPLSPLARIISISF